MRRFLSITMLAGLAVLLSATAVRGEIRLKSVCRVKGQEENTLHGMGLVVGLKGTGDGGNFLPEIRSLATMLQLMGNPIKGGAAELKDVKNVALVSISATIPAAGARQGDKLDCQVMSIGAAKSLEGGRLFMTPLIGPHDPEVSNPRVYAFAQGAVVIDNPKTPTTGSIHGGCRLEEDFFNVYQTKDGRINLVLDKNHADFELAWDIADRINNESPIRGDESVLARALDQVNIEVTIPHSYRSDPVSFLALILNMPISEPTSAATVFINESTGAIIIGEEVEVGPVVVSHKNLVIETAANLPAQRFFGVAPGKSEEEYPTQAMKLKSLAEALNAVKVPNEDVIDIIKGLDRTGKLHGRLIVE